MMVSEIPRHQTAWIFPGTLQPGKGQRAGGTAAAAEGRVVERLVLRERATGEHFVDVRATGEHFVDVRDSLTVTL